MSPVAITLLVGSCKEDCHHVAVFLYYKKL